MTKAISMAIELDQDNMVTNMCVKFGEDWTHTFQELDRKQSSGRMYVRMGDVRTRPTLYAATLWGHKKAFKVVCNGMVVSQSKLSEMVPFPLFVNLSVQPISCLLNLSIIVLDIHES